MSLGYAYSRVGELEKAAVQMQKYIRLAPDAADPRASYADILVYIGRYDEALDALPEVTRVETGLLVRHPRNRENL